MSSQRIYTKELIEELKNKLKPQFTMSFTEYHKASIYDVMQKWCQSIDGIQNYNINYEADPKDPTKIIANFSIQPTRSIETIKYSFKALDPIYPKTLLIINNKRKQYKIIEKKNHKVICEIYKKGKIIETLELRELFKLQNRMSPNKYRPVERILFEKL